MAYKLAARRVAFSLLTVVATVGVSMVGPAHAQEPGGRFRVLVTTPAVEGGVKESFAKKVADETRKLIDGMVTHRSVEKKDLNELLKKFKLKEKDLTCVTSQQLAVQGGYELVLCATLRPEADKVGVEATFITRDQTRFEVPPTSGSDPVVLARHIFTSFETFVNQLRLVQFCNEDLGSSQWEPALDKCSQALVLNPTSQAALYGKGYALMQLERYEEALGALQELIALNPIHSEALQAAGIVTAKLGRMEESRKYFNQFLELNPGNAHIRLTIALDAMRAGDPEGALEIAEKGLSAGADDLQLIEYAGYFAAAAALRKADERGNNGAANKEEAARLYEKALQYFGSVYEKKGAEVNAEVLAQMINAYTQLGRTQEAIDLAGKAVTTKSGEASIWRAYAAALKNADRILDAVSALDSVLAYDPNAQTIRAQQAQWLLQDGKLAEAGAAFRRAVDANEIESEAAGMTIFAIGVNDKFQKGKQLEAIPYFELAKQFVTKPYSKALVNFFHGLVLYYRGMEVGKPETLASARESLPIFQKALELFKQSGAYGEASPNNAKSLQDHLSATQTYIEIQEAIIKRGR